MWKITARRHLVALGLACAVLAGGPLARQARHHGPLTGRRLARGFLCCAGVLATMAFSAPQPGCRWITGIRAAS